MTSDLCNYLEEDTESSLSCTAQYLGLSFDDNSQALVDLEVTTGQQNAKPREASLKERVSLLRFKLGNLIYNKELIQ